MPDIEYCLSFDGDMLASLAGDEYDDAITTCIWDSISTLVLSSHRPEFKPGYRYDIVMKLCERNDEPTTE